MKINKTDPSTKQLKKFLSFFHSDLSNRQMAEV